MQGAAFLKRHGVRAALLQKWGEDAPLVNPDNVASEAKVPRLFTMSPVPRLAELAKMTSDTSDPDSW